MMSVGHHTELVTAQVRQEKVNVSIKGGSYTALFSLESRYLLQHQLHSESKQADFHLDILVLFH